MTDTSPKRLRELADKELRKWMAPSDLSNVLLALAAEKEAQSHPEQPLEGVKSADVPLPDPALAAVVTELFSTSPYYTADQMRQYGQACAKAARDAERYRWIEAVIAELACGEQAKAILQAAKKGTT